MPVTADDVRRVALALPRAYEALVRDQAKFRVGRIVFVALSRDETVMGFGFPRDLRAAAIEAEPEKFSLPGTGDLRYQWIHVRLAAIDEAELTELVIDAWAMCVPATVRKAWFGEAWGRRLTSHTFPKVSMFFDTALGTSQ